LFRVFVALSCFVTLQAYATRVQKMSPKRTLALVDDVDTSAIKVNDVICLNRPMKTQVCGLVIQIKDRTLVFSPADKKHNLEIGDEVTVQTSSRRFASKDNDPSGITMDTLGARARRLRDSHLLIVGTNLIQPVVRFEQGISKRLSLGIMPSFLYFPVSDELGATGAVTGWGIVGTASYYFKRPYRGMYAMAGVGFSYITATLGTDSGNTATLTALGTLGYRWNLGPTFNLGIAGGVQYFSNQNTATTSLTISIPSIFPAAFAELGISF
jgi:hypothetical protein